MAAINGELIDLVQDTSVRPGEDSSRDIQMVADEWDVAVMTADGQIKAGPGAVKGTMCIATAAGVYALYDGTSTSDRRITADTTPAVGAFLDLQGEAFSNGLYFELVSGTITLNVRYR